MSRLLELCLPHLLTREQYIQRLDEASDYDVATDSEIKAFVQSVWSNTNTQARMVIHLANTQKRTHILNETGLDIGLARELVVPSSIIHVQVKHANITLDDWVLLKKIATDYDAVVLSTTNGKHGENRLIFVKRVGGLAYAYVTDVSNGRKYGARLNLVTYFKTTSAGLLASLKQNGVENKKATSVLDALFSKP